LDLADRRVLRLQRQIGDRLSQCLFIKMVRRCVRAVDRETSAIGGSGRRRLRLRMARCSLIKSSRACSTLLRWRPTSTVHEATPRSRRISRIGGCDIAKCRLPRNLRDRGSFRVYGRSVREHNHCMVQSTKQSDRSAACELEGFALQAQRVHSQLAILFSQYEQWMPRSAKTFLKELDKCVCSSVTQSQSPGCPAKSRGDRGNVRVEPAMNRMQDPCVGIRART
jgi:hypothetical protein